MKNLDGQQNDAKIIEEVIKGNTETYREIVIRHQKHVYAYAFAIMRNDADAADITQEVFIRFFRNIEQFDARRPLSPYLLRITVNCSRNLFREKRCLFPGSEGASMDDLGLVADNKRNPLEDVMWQEKINKVRDLIEKLPLTLREVCSLFYLSEHSCSDVAKILRISENAVKVALHRARKKILESWSVCGDLEIS